MVTTLAPGTVVAGRYRVESLVGEGGMGAVYLVEHLHTDEKLAMKVLHAQTLRDESTVERFRREARAPAKVQSEHVARVTDADTAPELDGAPFYVMEYLRGKDLDTILTEGGPLPPPVVVEYMRQTARALDKAHGIGIVHRDLKPENLFLTTREDGTPCVKLLDFGIAKLVDQTTALASDHKTESGAVFGTPSFMSPEQTRGEVALVGPAADIWAFGLIAFKLLTGREYWQANVVAQLYVEILSAPLVAPSERGAAFGEAFDAWFLKCVAREIIDRFDSAGEAAAALGDALGVEMPRAAAASLAFLPFDPAATDSHKRTNVWPQAQATPKAKAGGFPTGIVLGVLGFGVLCVLALVIGVYRAMADEAAVDAAATPPAMDSSAAPTPLATAPGVSSEAAAASSASDEAAARRSTPAGTGHSSSKTASTSASDDGAKADHKDSAHEPNDDQRRRLESLQRLCDSGTVPAAECASKRAAIMRNPN